MINSISIKQRNSLFILFTVSTLFMAFLAFRKGTSSDVVTILSQLGIYNPPSWLVWALVFAGGTSVIVALLVSGGWIASIPAWAEAALLAADSYSV